MQTTSIHTHRMSLFYICGLYVILCIILKIAPFKWYNNFQIKRNKMYPNVLILVWDLLWEQSNCVLFRWNNFLISIYFNNFIFLRNTLTGLKNQNKVVSINIKKKKNYRSWGIPKVINMGKVYSSKIHKCDKGVTRGKNSVQFRCLIVITFKFGKKLKFSFLHPSCTECNFCLFCCCCFESICI